MALAFILYLIAYAAIGVLAGVMAGLLGVGGGIVIVPLLTSLFELQGFSPETTVHLALGTSLGTIVITSISSSRAHHRRGAVDVPIVMKLVPGIVIGTWLAGALAARQSSMTLKLVFSAFLVLVASQMLRGTAVRLTRQLPGRFGLNVVGFGIGAVSGLVGIGGGSMSVPFLLYCNVETRRAIGTSAAIGFPIAVAGTLSYLISGWGTVTEVPWAVGYLYLPALLGVGVFSWLSAPWGARLAERLPPERIKRGFSLFLLAVAVKMIIEVAL